VTRRRLLQLAGVAGPAIASFKNDALARARRASQAVAGQDPDGLASDETYWREIRQAFWLDRGVINLDCATVSPTPMVVHAALERYLGMSNQAPAHHMWALLEPNVESVRRRLAREFSCDPEELAITRSGSEALAIAQLGLDLRRGDEVVTTDQEFPQMLTTWQQRVERDGIRLVTIPIPLPVPDSDAVLRRFEERLTPRTRGLFFCHMTPFSGQVLPVADICRMARARGIVTIVDGAQALGQLKVDLSALGCDYYGASLHKWLMAPLGTGLLFARRARIAGLWPLQPAPATMRSNIRKFEQIGTHPAAGHNAIAEALAFHQAIGVDRKAARLRFLKRRWADTLAGRPRVRLLSNLEEPGAIATVAAEGVDPAAVAARLWDGHRIVVRPFTQWPPGGVRVAPNIFTTLAELDTFSEALERVLEP
jgi:selenocysteine lyase/cysteine desulfurase